MSSCRTEGELRAYLDRELTAEGMAGVGAHLVECGRCRSVFAEIRGRAERISALMGELERGGPSVVPIRRSAPRWLGAVAVAGLAASLTVGYIAMPKRTPRTPDRGAFGGVTTSEPATLPGGRNQVPEIRGPETPSGVQDTPSRQAPRRPVRKPRAPAPAARPPAPRREYFLALDDEPIEGSALLVRVALGPAGIPADVVFSPNGRPRAIRLANYTEGENR